MHYKKYLGCFRVEFLLLVHLFYMDISTVNLAFFCFQLMVLILKTILRSKT